MASSRSLLVLVGLLVACLCATASAGRVVPVETSRKLVDVGPAGGSIINVALEVDLRQFDATNTVSLTFLNAVDKPVFVLVGGVVSKLYIKVCLSVEDPLELLCTIDALGIAKDVEVPLALLDPLLDGLPLAAISAISGVLKLVATVVGGVVTKLVLLNKLGTIIQTIKP